MCLDCEKKMYANNYVVNNSPYDGYPIGCCALQEGFYCVWTLNHAAMECEEWAELCDLRAVIRSISHIAFNVVSERARARTSLLNLRTESPFSECKRFPWRKTYVNISCSVYSALFQDILSSLDFKDRETEKEMRYGNNHKQDDKDQTSAANSSLDDAKTRFRNSLIKLQNSLCKRDEVYDRVKFEKKYELEWCVGPCPKDPGSPDNPNKPIPPNSRTYGDMMTVMRRKGLDPVNFSVFTSSDMVKNDFQCDRETQVLGPNMGNMKLPQQAFKVFLFAKGEYAECNESGQTVDGYVYDKATNTLEGPLDLKKYGRLVLSVEEEPKLTSTQWQKVISIAQKLTGDNRGEDLQFAQDLIKEVLEEDSSSGSYDKCKEV